MVMEIKEHMPKVALAIARKVADKALDENAEAVITDGASRLRNHDERTETCHHGA